MFNGGTRKRPFSDCTDAPSPTSVTPSSTTPSTPIPVTKAPKSPAKSPKSEAKPKTAHLFKKQPDFLSQHHATAVPPQTVPPPTYFPHFESCLDNFLSGHHRKSDFDHRKSEFEKSAKIGGDSGESSGIQDYGLWPHPQLAAPASPPSPAGGASSAAASAAAAAAAAAAASAAAAFPFPYSFFWPSKRPSAASPASSSASMAAAAAAAATATPFAPFHTSLLGN